MNLELLKEVAQQYAELCGYDNLQQMCADFVETEDSLPHRIKDALRQQPSLSGQYPSDEEMDALIYNAACRYNGDAWVFENSGEIADLIRKACDWAASNHSEDLEGWDAKAYTTMRDEIEYWKTKAAEADAALERIRNDLGPTHMGEPVIPQWAGWACQYPGKLPRLYGAREIAEVNCDRENGDTLIYLQSSAAHQVDDRPAIACKHCGGFGEITGEYPGVVCPVCNGTCVDAPAAQPQVPESKDWVQYVYWIGSSGAKHNGLHPTLTGLISAAKEEGR